MSVKDKIRDQAKRMVPFLFAGALSNGVQAQNVEPMEKAPQEIKVQGYEMENETNHPPAHARGGEYEVTIEDRLQDLGVYTSTLKTKSDGEFTFFTAENASGLVSINSKGDCMIGFGIKEDGDIKYYTSLEPKGKEPQLDQSIEAQEYAKDVVEKANNLFQKISNQTSLERAREKLSKRQSEEGVTRVHIQPENKELHSDGHTTKEGIFYVMGNDNSILIEGDINISPELYPSLSRDSKTGDFVYGSSRSKDQVVAYSLEMRRIKNAVIDNSIYNHMKERLSNGETLSANETNYMQQSQVRLQKELKELGFSRNKNGKLTRADNSMPTKILQQSGQHGY